MSAPLRLGTRRSALATAQSQQIADLLATVSGREVVLVPITSEGDISRASLSQLGGRGVFATRLREALLAGECDLLVHSLKDLPTAEAPGLVIAATPRREDARDLVITRDAASLAEMAAGSVVGTGSPRRIAQLRRRNPGLVAHDLRGNVDSRLARVRDGELDAIILAAAGLARLGGGAADLFTEPLELEQWPTAPGQGSLAVEARQDAPDELLAAISRLDDAATRVAVTVERAVLAGLDAGCSAPVGVHAVLAGDRLHLRAAVYASDGSRSIEAERNLCVGDGYAGPTGSGDGARAAGDDDPIAGAREIGNDVARELLERGAAEVSP